MVYANVYGKCYFKMQLVLVTFVCNFHCITVEENRKVGTAIHINKFSDYFHSD